MDIIKEVFNWNKERGLLDKGYKKELEASFISEELSELLRGDGLSEDIDAYIDSIIFQIGALSKILQSEDAIKECFNAVLIANSTKGKNCDKSGKILKDKQNFTPPNEVIRDVLNRAKT